MICSKNCVTFLDVEVSKTKSRNTLSTSLFTKPADNTHQFRILFHATNHSIRDLHLMDKQSE